MSQLRHARHRSPALPPTPAPAPARRSTPFRRGQRGLTLVELMVAVLVASVLIGFVFEIQGRMSTAFRSQTNIGALQQGIRAANELIARDTRLAGFMAPTGIRVSDQFGLAPVGLTPGLVQDDGFGNLSVPAVVIRNNPSARGPQGMQPDSIHVFYADPNPVAQAVVTDIVDPTTVVVNTEAIFLPGDLVLFARRDPTPRPHPLGPDLPLLTNYFTCMVRLTNVGGNLLQFADDAGEPFNTPDNRHCFQPTGDLEEAIAVGKPEKTQVFRLIARAYRIDTDATRLAIGALQRSETAGLRDDWQEIGIGFVDLQVSQYYVEEVSDGVDTDLDGNPRGEWFTTDAAQPPNLHRTQISIALVARTPRSVEGVSAATVPVLTCNNLPPGCTPANNPFGDAGGPKDIHLPEYNPEDDILRGGEHVYRQSMTIVDIRNLEVSY